MAAEIMDLFGETESGETGTAMKLDVVRMEYAGAESLSWEELFDGFDDLKAITFSSGGYVPGTATTNECAFVGTRTTEKLVKDLAPGEWMWAVRSFDAEGRDSPWSPFRTVVLDPTRPPRLRPGFMLQIR